MENTRLKEENNSLRRRNQWLTQRLTEQTNMMKIKTKHQEQHESAGEFKASKLLNNWYFLMSDVQERLAFVGYRVMFEDGFETALNRLLKDFCEVVPVEGYSFRIVVDEDTSDVVTGKGVGPGRMCKGCFPGELESLAGQRARKLLKNLGAFNHLIIEE